MINGDICSSGLCNPSPIKPTPKAGLRFLPGLCLFAALAWFSGLQGAWHRQVLGISVQALGLSCLALSFFSRAWVHSIHEEDCFDGLLESQSLHWTVSERQHS